MGIILLLGQLLQMAFRAHDCAERRSGFLCSRKAIQHVGN